jgi:methionyl-tRNA formyltransferase
MKILFLGKEDSPLIPWIQSYGDSVVHCSQRLTDDEAFLSQFDFLISYNYRYIISGKILDRFPYRAINLHISLLPWNRGADPNFWSFFENTPSGVTIHYIDVGLDTGEIVYQRELEFEKGKKNTLASTYEALHKELQQLFCDHWPEIRALRCPRNRQPAHYGTYHKMKDKEPLEYIISDGWNTPVEKLQSNPDGKPKP